MESYSLQSLAKSWYTFEAFCSFNPRVSILVYGDSSQCAQIYKLVRLCDTASGLTERLASLSERHPVLDRLRHVLICFDLRLYKGNSLFEQVGWADHDTV